MKNKLLYSFEDDLNERLKNPKFVTEWRKFELEYQIARQIIRKRLALKYSQRELAKKVETTQAMISRLETMVANPSLELLKRIASALDTRIAIQFQ